MNLPATFEALAIVAFVLVPGFIFITFSRGALASHPESVDIRYFLLVISAGIILQITAWTVSGGWILDRYNLGDLTEHQTEAGYRFLVSTVIWPIAVSFVFNWFILNSYVDRVLFRMGISYIHRLPSAWDYFVRTGPFYVKIFLKEGGMIAGKYGKESKATVSKKDKDLFLQEVWSFDEARGEFIEPLKDNGGIWIDYDSIHYVQIVKSVADPEVSNE